MINIKELSADDLGTLRSQIDQELAVRANTAPLIATQLNFDSGNWRAGARCWVKAPSGVDPKKSNGWGIIGSFVSEIHPDKSNVRWFDVQGSEGALIVASGMGGSHRNSTKVHVVLRIKSGVKLEFSSGYQHLSGDHLEILKCEKSRSELLNIYPDLKGVNPEWFEVFALLLLAAIPRAASEPPDSKQQIQESVI